MSDPEPTWGEAMAAEVRARTNRADRRRCARRGHAWKGGYCVDCGARRG